MSISPPLAEGLYPFQSRGAPRVVGAAQGRVLRRLENGREESPVEALLRGASWVLHWGGRSPASPLSWEERQALRRDLRRHFPHFSERALSLARVAGQRADWAALVDPASRAFALQLLGASEGRLACTIPPGPWMLRDVTLEGGRRSLGLAVPEWPAQLAGLNEAGLCGLALVDAPLFPWARQPGEPVLPPAIFAPGWLLLDQCLERFDRVEPALAWCERRPGSGRVTLVFGDAAGQSAAITLEGNRRIRGTAPRSPHADTSVANGAEICALDLDPKERTLRIAGPGFAAREVAIGSG